MDRKDLTFMTENLDGFPIDPGWLAPVWETETCYRETMAMVWEDGEDCAAPFAFMPKKILSVENYAGTVRYEEGRDYVVRDRMLYVCPTGRIQCLERRKLVFETEEEAREAQRSRGMALDFGPVACVGGGYLNLGYIGNARALTDGQLAVTYKTDEAWDGYVPGGQMDRLPRLNEKLAKGAPITVVFYGDSISCGFDSGGLYGDPPLQPIWPALLAEQLKMRWKSPVRFMNTSVGGVGTEWAIENAKERVCAHEPDLVILGFGMNDRCLGAEYGNMTGKLMEEIRAGMAETEFVLIATSLPNPLARTAPYFFWAHQDEYADALRQLAGSGVALADVQSVQKHLMKRKRYVDMTGNWLNHPNDYLARIHAQVLDKVLS